MAGLDVRSAYGPDEAIPRRFTCQGKDVSIPVAWTKPPAGTQSIAAVFDDPDAPGGTWVHWLWWDLPPDAASVGEGEEVALRGARVGRNSWGRASYGGPCPPRGRHRYVLKLFALDARLSLAAGATVQELEAAMRGHVLASGSLTGTYEKS